MVRFRIRNKVVVRVTLGWVVIQFIMVVKVRIRVFKVRNMDTIRDRVCVRIRVGWIRVSESRS